MSRIVSYLSRPNHEVRDTTGRFEGTFRWRWMASLWATLHPDRRMHLVPAVRRIPQLAVAPAVPAESTARRAA
jgi:hypothetical protein